MKNALILHGTGNDSTGNWFPWLKKELKSKGWEVWVPDLPDSEHPNIKRYNELIFSNKDWKFDSESIIIGHSSGATEILGLLMAMPENVVIDTCIFVGFYKNDLGDNDLRMLFDGKASFDKIKKHAKNFIIIHSDNDPYCPIEMAEYLANKVDGKLIIKEGQGHFNLDKSPEYKEFPLILELLKDN